MKITPEQIGFKIRLPYWDECYLEVLDVGTKYIMGNIRDGADDYIIAGADQMHENSDEWEIYTDIDQILNKLKSK